MNNDKLLIEIQRLAPWYQNVKFNDDVTVNGAHSKLSGEYAWNYIKQLLPESLNGMRVLDIGSNAGLFSIRASQMGAKEVIGLEKEPKHLRQCAFLKEYFKTDNVKFLNQDLNTLHLVNIGKFDYILAISVLYWVGRVGVSKGNHYNKIYRDKEIEFIKHISKLSDNFIIRARGKEYNSAEYYCNIFSRLSFELVELINEEIGTHEMMFFKKRQGSV